MPEREPYPSEKPLPLPAEGFGSFAWWQDAIEAATKKRDEKLPGMKKNVQRYLGEYAGSPDDVHVNVDFYNTEQKKAQLFFRTPDMQLTAKRPECVGAVPVFQAVLNHYLGPQKTNVAAMMDESLFDLLCPAGLRACKIGYEATEDGQVLIQVGMKPGAPMPGTVLGINTPMVPDLQPAPNVIAERYFADRISPAALLIPKPFHGSDYDKAPWLGFDFVQDLAIAKRLRWVPEDFSGSGEDKYKLVDDAQGDGGRPIVIGKEIWYRASVFDSTAKHPERFRQLLLIDGLTAPAVHRDSPYQRFDPQTGKFLGGMKGNPIDVGALRYVSDTAYPPSDCTISRGQVDELSEARTQMQKQRRRSLPLRWFDRNRVDPTDVDRLKRADIQGYVPLDGNGNEIIGEAARAEYPRENFAIINVIQQDVDKEWSLGSNQNGVTEDTVRSATELSIIQTNTNVRLDYERTKLLGQVIRIAEKIGSLIQLFADQEDYIEVVGAEGEKRLEAWDKTRIQGEFAYSAKPDSAQRLDASQDRKLFNEYLNFNAKNPNMNLLELTRIGAEKYNYDPARLIQQPQPAGPPPPNVSVRITMDDVVGPASAIAIECLQQGGFKLSPQAVAAAAAGQARVEAAAMQEQEAQREHGGTADKNEMLSKHSGEETGNLPNAPAAMM